jgi:CheY-like chemotaxis protein
MQRHPQGWTRGDGGADGSCPSAWEQQCQAERFEAYHNLAGGLVHHLSNTLTAIQGFAQFVMADLSVDHPSQADIQEVLAGTGRAFHLMDRLLAVCGHVAGTEQSVDVRDFLQAFGAVRRQELPEGTGLQVTARCDSAVAIVPAALETALTELVTNAQNAMPQGGVIRLTVDDVPRGMPGGVMTDQPYVRFAVADDGPGLGAIIRQRFGEPFAGGRRPEDRGGLGLAVVRGVVGQYGGHVAVDDAAGQGTCVSLYLPAIGRGESQAPSGAAAEPTPADRTILLVDDDPAVRRVIGRFLTRNGFTVLEAGSGRQAVVLLDNPPMPIDLVLSDVTMPGMSGLDLAAHVAHRPEALPVLLMSAGSLAKLPADVLSKPIEGTILLRRLALALR